MNLGNANNEPRAPRSALPSERELRDLLAASERRIEDDLKSKSRVVTIILGVPALLFIGWVTIFLIRYNPGPQSPQTEAVVAASALPAGAANPDGSPELDRFLPAQLRAARDGKPAPQPQGDRKLIDKGDIEFASWLLNYTHAGEKPQPKQ